MKRFFSSADAPSANVSNFGRTPLYDAVYIIAMMLLATSCIYDAPGDKFYRTLWVSEETSCGKLTIEFLCGESVCVTATGAVGSFGTYDTYGTTAYLANLRLNYYLDGPENNPLVIILEEAHRTDDLLLLSWHYSGSPVSYTTRLVRKGSYE